MLSEHNCAVVKCKQGQGLYCVQFSGSMRKSNSKLKFVKAENFSQQNLQWSSVRMSDGGPVLEGSNRTTA